MNELVNVDFSFFQINYIYIIYFVIFLINSTSKVCIEIVTVRINPISCHHPSLLLHYAAVHFAVADARTFA